MDAFLDFSSNGAHQTLRGATGFFAIFDFHKVNFSNGKTWKSRCRKRRAGNHVNHKLRWMLFWTFRKKNHLLLTPVHWIFRDFRLWKVNFSNGKTWKSRCRKRRAGNIVFHKQNAMLFRIFVTKSSLLFTPVHWIFAIFDFEKVNLSNGKTWKSRCRKRRSGNIVFYYAKSMLFWTFLPSEVLNTLLLCDGFYADFRSQKSKNSMWPRQKTRSQKRLQQVLYMCSRTGYIFTTFPKKSCGFCCKTLYKNGVIFLKKVSKRYTCIPKREVKIRPWPYSHSGPAGPRAGIPGFLVPDSFPRGSFLP